MLTALTGWKSNSCNSSPAKANTSWWALSIYQGFMPLPTSKMAMRQSADRVDSEFREKKKLSAAQYTADCVCVWKSGLERALLGWGKGQIVDRPEAWSTRTAGQLPTVQRMRKESGDGYSRPEVTAAEGHLAACQSTQGTWEKWTVLPNLDG